MDALNENKRKCTYLCIKNENGQWLVESNMAKITKFQKSEFSFQIHHHPTHQNENKKLWSSADTYRIGIFVYILKSSFKKAEALGTIIDMDPDPGGRKTPDPD